MALATPDAPHVVVATWGIFCSSILGEGQYGFDVEGLSIWWSPDPSWPSVEDEKPLMGDCRSVEGKGVEPDDL